MRVPMSWIRTLLGFAILLLCVRTGGTPIKGAGSTGSKGFRQDYTCLYSPCVGYKDDTNGVICNYTTTNAGWTCTVRPTLTCGFDDTKYGGILCAGIVQNTNPASPCSYYYASCLNLVPNVLPPPMPPPPMPPPPMPPPPLE